MTEDKLLTNFQDNVQKSGKGITLRTGLTTPDEAENNAVVMELKKPNPPLRVLLRPDPLW